MSAKHPNKNEVDSPYGKRLKAAEKMDWQQVVLNGGPPCFHLENNGCFCGRARQWHEVGIHKFVSLAMMLRESHA